MCICVSVAVVCVCVELFALFPYRYNTMFCDLTRDTF